MSESTKRSDTHEERYFHIRPQTLEELYGLLPFLSMPFKGATVFYREEDGVWYGSIALCSWEDQFSRKAGRSVARRRYFTTNLVVHEQGLHEPVFDDALTLFERVCASY